MKHFREIGGFQQISFAHLKRHQAKCCLCPVCQARGHQQEQDGVLLSVLPHHRDRRVCSTLLVTAPGAFKIPGEWTRGCKGGTAVPPVVGTVAPGLSGSQHLTLNVDLKACGTPQGRQLVPGQRQMWRSGDAWCGNPSALVLLLLHRTVVIAFGKEAGPLGRISAINSNLCGYFQLLNKQCTFQECHF